MVMNCYDKLENMGSLLIDVFFNQGKINKLNILNRMFIRFRAVRINLCFQFSVFIDCRQIRDGLSSAATRFGARIIGVAVDESGPLHRLGVQILDAIQEHFPCSVSTNDS